MGWLFRIVGWIYASIERLFSWLFGGDAGASGPPEPAEFIVEAPPAMTIDAIASVFRERLGGSWQVRKMFRNFDPNRDLADLERFFLASRPQPVEGNPFDASYSLMKGTQFMSATPNLAFTPPRQNPFRKSDAPAPEDRAWHLKQMKVEEAWQVTKGAGVLVGHPDTGWTRHVDLDAGRLRIDLAFDFLRNQLDSEDPLSEADVSALERANVGHGTKSSSVIFSGGGIDPAFSPGSGAGGTTPPGKITGVAPEAELVPIRCARSVVIVKDDAVAAAVHHAVDKKCDVISISLGGFPSPVLHAAVRNAVANNVIVVAAAGNEVSLVVFPAGWPECLAAGASGVSGDTDWDGSSWGPPVDICAPGERVWCAVDGGAPNAQGRGEKVAAHSGTTFAAANVAGVAALWVAAHGRRKLLDKYRGLNFLQEVFKHVISTTAHVPDGWDHIAFGAGIIRADRVVRAPLPDLAPNPVTVIKSILEWFLEQFSAMQREFARIQLVMLFAGPGRTLTDAELESLMQRYGVELMHLFMNEPDAFESFRRSVEERAAGRAEEARATLQEGGERLAEAGSAGLNQVMSWVS